MAAALEALGERACARVRGGASILVLSDRGGTSAEMPIPSLLALAAVHHALMAAGLRQGCGLVVESGEPREVMHFALLIGYGAGAVNPYLALDAIGMLAAEGELTGDVGALQAKFVKAIEKGLLKVMSKMGISTIQSYRGARSSSVSASTRCWSLACSAARPRTSRGSVCLTSRARRSRVIAPRTNGVRFRSSARPRHFRWGGSTATDARASTTLGTR